jgi:putative FmdB family regulatory protein
MPIYEFECNKCNAKFDELCSSSEVENVRCSSCNSKKVTRLFSSNVYVKFTNPKDTSKWDNFEYRAGYNMEKAKEERRQAEEVAKGDNPYANWNLEKDLHNDKNWGDVK